MYEADASSGSPLIVYLDTQDYSRLADALHRDEGDRVQVYKELQALKARYNVRFAYVVTATGDPDVPYSIEYKGPSFTPVIPYWKEEGEADAGGE